MEFLKNGKYFFYQIWEFLLIPFFYLHSW